MHNQSLQLTARTERFCKKEHRNIFFEEIAFYIENGGFLDSYEHPKKERYPRQSIFVVRTDFYVYIVPYVEEDKYYFLKTIIPNSEAKKIIS